MLLPSRLKKGSKLAVTAFSTPITVPDAVLEAGLNRLRASGFEVILARNVKNTVGHAAGTVAERVTVLHELFQDPSIDGIINFWGGFQSHQLAEYLDFALIKRNPKVFVGYSDTTALLNLITERTGLVTFLGASVITFCKPTVPEISTRSFLAALCETKPVGKLPIAETFSDNPFYKEPDGKMIFDKNPGWKVFQEGTATGEIIGGNLGTLLLYAGTRYMPNLKGKILFCEEDETESTETIDRLFTKLRQMGVFDQIAGLVVGRFPRCVGFNEQDTFEDILDESLKGYKIPVITGVDFGHTDPILTIPIGVNASISTSPLQIEILEAAVV